MSLLLAVAPATAWSYDVVTGTVPSPDSLAGTILFSVVGGAVIGIPLGVSGILLGYAGAWIAESGRSGVP